MTDSVTIGLVAAGSSLLTIIVSPWLQHHFWRYQRRAELRLAAVNEFNRLTNAYVAACFAGRAIDLAEPEWTGWLGNVNAAVGTIQVLFSGRAYQAAKRINPMLAAPWVGDDRMARAHAFTEARREALTALYREVIPIRGRWVRSGLDSN